MSPYTPPAEPSVRVIRSSPWKGGSRQWSQRYFFTGTDPTDTQFDNIFNFLRDELKAVTLTESNLIEYIGYHRGSDVPVYTRTATTAGTYPATGNPVMPLEVAVLARMTTDARTSKNHPIYGFKYFHNIQNDGGSDHEKARVGYVSTLGGQLADILTGIPDGTTTRQWCDARGAVFQSRFVLPELTHRDFPNL